MQPEHLAALHDWFGRYVAGFTGESPADQRNYDLKVVHTRNVCAIMGRLTAAEGLTGEGRRVAEAVALCHDLGRFPQYHRYRTFNDAVSADHGALGVATLRRAGVLSALPRAAGEALLRGVALHNVFRLPRGLSPDLLRLARLIRDADKLDIWRVLIEHCTAPPDRRASAVTWGLPVTGACSPRVIEEVRAGRMVDRALLATQDDFKLLQLSWVFDLNFAESFAILAERGYIETLSALLPDQGGCGEAVAAVKDHLSLAMAGGQGTISER